MKDHVNLNSVVLDNAEFLRKLIITMSLKESCNRIDTRRKFSRQEKAIFLARSLRN